jgi:glycosyltransferase involved in cell wall biosynthesis
MNELGVSGQQPLRILIDLRWMIPGQAGGLEDVAYCFLEHLLARGDGSTLTLLIPSELTDRFRSAVPDHVLLRSCDDLLSDLQRVRRLVGLGKSGRVTYDVAYSMNGRLHQDVQSIPALVMIPDLQHMALPDLFTAQERETRTLASREVAHLARRIVTISDYSRQSIIAQLGISPDRVATSLLAVDQAFETTMPVTIRDRVLAKYGLQGRSYLYLPAHLWPHKNHRTVIEAVRVLVNGAADDLLLVCSGTATTEYGAALIRDVAASEVGRFVRFIGRCPRGDVPALYAGAEALVFCSLHEGFGMPVIEAMRMGCPVIAANTTSLPEISGSAALLVDPLDATAIAAAVLRLREEPELRQSLIAAGRVRAQDFSWERHCTEIIALLYEAVGRRPPNAETRQYPELRQAALGTSPAARFRQSFYPVVRRRLIAALRRQ